MKKVIYIGANDAQVNWLENDDPRGLLEEDGHYEVEKEEVNFWQTKLCLAGFPGKKFNSVCFDVAPVLELLETDNPITAKSQVDGLICIPSRAENTCVQLEATPPQMQRKSLRSMVTSCLSKSTGKKLAILSGIAGNKARRWIVEVAPSWFNRSH